MASTPSTPSTDPVSTTAASDQKMLQEEAELTQLSNQFNLQMSAYEAQMAAGEKLSGR
jgi:hypothetical protein